MITDNTTFIVRFLILDVQVVEVQGEVMITQKTVLKKSVPTWKRHSVFQLVKRRYNDKAFLAHFSSRAPTDCWGVTRFEGVLKLQYMF